MLMYTNLILKIQIQWDLNWKYIIITNLKLKTNLKLSKVATIDIGSNAIRLLISNVFEIKGIKFSKF